MLLKICLQRLEERDEGLAVLLGKLQAKGMALDRAGLHAEAAETRRDVVVVQAAGVEPVLQGRHRTRVLEGSAIPDAPEGWDFVEARPAPGVERQTWVGSDGE